MAEHSKRPNFYIIATPIGDYGDITVRALQTLQNVDFIVCEHEREYKKLFSILQIPEKKYIVSDKKREENSLDLVLELLRKGESGAMISDCGTPLFEDPGYRVLSAIRRANEKKLIANIVSLPGPNSLITAMTLAPFQIKQFFFAGFITRNSDLRDGDIQKLLRHKETVAFMESPYRLQNTLQLLKKNAGKRKILIATDLTLPAQKLYYGHADSVARQIAADGLEKAEFIVFLEEV